MLLTKEPSTKNQIYILRDPFKLFIKHVACSSKKRKNSESRNRKKKERKGVKWIKQVRG